MGNGTNQTKIKQNHWVPLYSQKFHHVVLFKVSVYEIWEALKSLNFAADLLNPVTVVTSETVFLKSLFTDYTVFQNQFF